MALPTVADWLERNAIFYAVHRVEGNPDTDVLKTMSFSTLADADHFIYMQSQTAPLPGHGYHKVMVTVYYRDGEKRDFRIDMTKGGNNTIEFYYSKLFGDAGNAPTTEQSVNPEEMAAIKRRVCSYCAEKLKKEALETRQYVALEKDARKLTNGHVFLDVLFEAQETEIRELRTLYKAICEDTDKEV
jgi:hypothetical protein